MSPYQLTRSNPLRSKTGQAEGDRRASPGYANDRHDTGQVPRGECLLKDIWMADCLECVVDAEAFGQIADRRHRVHSGGIHHGGRPKLACPLQLAWGNVDGNHLGRVRQTRPLNAARADSPTAEDRDAATVAHPRRIESRANAGDTLQPISEACAGGIADVTTLLALLVVPRLWGLLLFN